jgi:hypothetical protein
MMSKLYLLLPLLYLLVLGLGIKSCEEESKRMSKEGRQSYEQSCHDFGGVISPDFECVKKELQND